MFVPAKFEVCCNHNIKPFLHKSHGKKITFNVIIGIDFLLLLRSLGAILMGKPETGF